MSSAIQQDSCRIPCFCRFQFVFFKKPCYNKKSMEEIKHTVPEMKAFMDKMSGIYDIVRLVNASECYTITMENDDSISYGNNCFCTWERNGRCKNCSSYRAHVTGSRQEKTETFNGKQYRIMSVPATLILNDGTPCSCVIELITIIAEQNAAPDAPNTAKSAYEHARSSALDSSIVSEKDMLTQLDSKEVFFRKVRQELMDNPDDVRYIIYADIDDFKLVNDLFGRIQGNEILLKTAEYIQDVCAKEHLCCRMAGDIFAFSLKKEDYDESALERVVEKISLLIQNTAYPLKIRFGIYEIVSPEMTVSFMCDCAKLALKSIKGDNVRHIAWYNNELVEQKKYEQGIVGAFDQALANREFQIYLQPQIDSETVLQGAEVLVRWLDPEKGLIPPVAFIGIFEKTGLISQLDKNVWEQAAETLKKWQGTNKSHLYLSINISAKDFYYLDVYKTLTEIVEKYQIDPHKLRLEITESVLMSDVEKLLALTRRLHQYGFFIEIDDFGKGYSSLAMLKDIDVDVLKIDMEFLRETEHEEKSRVILGSIINMSKQLGIAVITEGVETKNQMELLQDLGCNMFQGFYFAKPMPVPEFERKYF